MASAEAVCPRCGTPSDGRRACQKCGLELSDRDLPSRERWERGVLEAAASFARDETGSVAIRKHPRPLRSRALPSWTELSRRMRAALLLPAAFAVVLGVVLLSRLGGDGSTGNPEADRASAVEFALSRESVHGNFPQLGSARDIACQQSLEYRGQFNCTWTLETGDQGGGIWKLRKDGHLGRVSEGGLYADPPASAAEASRRVTEVVQQRGEGRAECRSSSPRERLGSGSTATFSCAVFNLSGDPVLVDGEETRSIWRWNPDGTVGRETLEAAGARPTP